MRYLNRREVFETRKDQFTTRKCMYGWAAEWMEKRRHTFHFDREMVDLCPVAVKSSGGLSADAQRAKLAKRREPAWSAPPGFRF